MCWVMDIAFISFLGFGLLHYFREVDAVAVDGTSRHEGGHLFHKFEIHACLEITEISRALHFIAIPGILMVCPKLPASQSQPICPTQDSVLSLLPSGQQTRDRTK